MRVAEPIFRSWKADLALGFDFQEGRTVLSAKRFDGPLVVQKPFYPEGPQVCHAIVVHPPAGMAGGDDLTLRVRIEEGASVLLTTPGAGKWYRSGGVPARQGLEFDVAGGLEWLPQETIVFDGAQAQIEADVRLAARARYIGWEVLCLGRAGSGETFRQGRIGLANRISREGKPLWMERGAIEAGGRLMRSPAGLGGKTVCATLVAAAPDIDRDVVAACRAVEGVAVTLLPGMLVARHLGDSGEFARARFAGLWKILRPAILGREAAEPRIWRT